MQDDVKLVKDKVDIVSLVGEFVALKKAGRHWKGLCPFHQEKSPSFIVSPELQIYKCFGCGETGDIFTFLQKYEGLDFSDALKTLADRAQVTLTKKTGGLDAHLKDTLYEINEVTTKFYHYILLNLPAGKEYLDYLTKERHLTRETIEAFAIGAAPNNPKILFDFLTKKKKFSPEDTVLAGVIYKTDDGRYVDRFRNRIVFPIQNVRGVTVALSGRILPTSSQAKTSPKYINSPETPIYKKSESLFGFSLAKDAMKKEQIAVVVEGEFDMISPWQNGLKNIVAIKGSALTEAHARILSRFVKTVVLALDTDFAGNTAAIKGISHAQEVGVDVKVARLGEYKDPDELVQKNPKALHTITEEALGVWDFLIDVFFERYSSDTPQGKLTLSRELVPYLSEIKDPILRAHYVRLVANRLGVPEEAVEASVKRSTKENTTVADSVREVSLVSRKPEHKPRREVLEEHLIALGCLYKKERLIEEDILSVIESNFAKRILSALKEYKTTPFDIYSFTKTLPTEIQTRFSELLLLIEGESMDFEKEFNQTLLELKSLTLKNQILTLTAEITDLDKEGKEAEISALQVKIGELTSMLAKLKS